MENRSVIWWPLRPEDVILYLEPSVLPHPEALKGIVSMISSQTITLPISLSTAVEYVYHLGWVSSDGRRDRGGGDVFMADQLSSLDAPSPRTSINLPGSAILSLFGGLDAVMQMRLSQSIYSPNWAVDFGHNQSRDILQNSIDQGVDVRGGYRFKLAKTDENLSSASFSSIILNSLGKTNESDLKSATLLLSLQLSSPQTVHTRFVFSYLAGRLGNYFINLLNSLALARVSNRVALIRSPENPNDDLEKASQGATIEDNTNTSSEGKPAWRFWM